MKSQLGAANLQSNLHESSIRCDVWGNKLKICDKIHPKKKLPYHDKKTFSNNLNYNYFIFNSLFKN